MVMDEASLSQKKRTGAMVDCLIETERRTNNRQFTAVQSYHLGTQPKDEAAQIHLLIRNPEARFWPENILEVSLDGHPVLTSNFETLILKANLLTARAFLQCCSLCYPEDQVDTPTKNLPAEMKDMVVLWDDVVCYIRILMSREKQIREEASAPTILSKSSNPTPPTLPRAPTPMDTAG